jgi:hypothetical protein
MEPDDLYGLPLERFTPERNALAKALRQQGRRDEAAEVSKLRKPSVTAWAVNQLVRTQKREVSGLFKAGDRLARAQASLLAGRGNPGSLRKAVEAERAAVDELVKRARGLLSAGGAELSATRLDQVRDTLHAAALDDDARAQVRAGCLERELRHIGLGTLGGGAPAAQEKPGQKSSAKARSDQKKREAEAAAARRAAAHAQRRRGAEDRLREAEGTLGEAEAAIRDAEEAMSAARAAHDRAVRDRDRAQRQLNDLG